MGLVDLVVGWLPLVLAAGVLAVNSNRVINEVQGVNRVVYDISSLTFGHHQWE